MHERGPKGALNEPFGAPKVHERCTFLTPPFIAPPLPNARAPVIWGRPGAAVWGQSGCGGARPALGRPSASRAVPLAAPGA